MARETIRYVRRGTIVELPGGDPAKTLLDHLRLDCQAIGTKEGCNEGDCGACTIVLVQLRDGHLVHRPVNACILLAGQVDGCEIITVEDLATDRALHPVQQAMVDNHGSQCGFCTPGIVMSLFALYQEASRPVTRQIITDQLAGNLCRCTGYRPIIAAAHQVCEGPADDHFRRDVRVRAEILQSLGDGEDIFVGTRDRFFAAPHDVATLAALYAAHPDATLVAGATDAGLWVTKRLADLPKIIWLGRVRGLDAIRDHGDQLEIGATATIAAVRTVLAAIDPDLGEVVRRFGSEQVRASATVGGNIANGSPIGDIAPCLIALDAAVRLNCNGTQRTVSLEKFFIEYGRQDRAPGEFVAALIVPKLAESEHFRAFKVSKRFDEDISAVMGAFRFRLDGSVIGSARVAFGGMAGTPKRGLATERALAGIDLRAPAGWEAAVEALSVDYAPIDDMRATGSYRLATARALLQKALFELGAAPSRLTRVVGHREATGATR